MLVLNFSHPFTSLQIAEIKRLANAQIESVVEIKTKLDPALSFAEQTHALVECIGLSSEEWQTESLLINLPSFSPVTALVLAELHGRIGYFPAVLRLRRNSNETPPQIEIAEIINLQTTRDAARQQR